MGNNKQVQTGSQEKQTAKPVTAQADGPLPDYLEASGWRRIPQQTCNDINIVYGTKRVGQNFVAVRVQVMPDGSVLSLALPENMKEIIMSRLLDSIEREA